MPHDAFNRLLKVGDEVVLRGKILSIYQEENYCNCSIQAEHDMRIGEGSFRKETLSSINTHMLEKIEREITV